MPYGNTKARLSKNYIGKCLYMPPAKSEEENLVLYLELASKSTKDWKWVEEDELADDDAIHFSANAMFFDSCHRKQVDKKTWTTYLNKSWIRVSQDIDLVEERLKTAIAEILGNSEYVGSPHVVESDGNKETTASKVTKQGESSSGKGKPLVTRFEKQALAGPSDDPIRLNQANSISSEDMDEDDEEEDDEEEDDEEEDDEEDMEEDTETPAKEAVQPSTGASAIVKPTPSTKATSAAEPNTANSASTEATGKELKAKDDSPAAKENQADDSTEGNEIVVDDTESGEKKIDGNTAGKVGQGTGKTQGKAVPAARKASISSDSATGPPQKKQKSA